MKPEFKLAAHPLPAPGEFDFEFETLEEKRAYQTYEETGCFESTSDYPGNKGNRKANRLLGCVPRRSWQIPAKNATLSVIHEKRWYDTDQLEVF